jgi:nucleotide-binding universal stress UspA family protein
VGTDFSDAVTPALVFGGTEAKLRGVELILIHSTYERSSPLDLLGPLVVSPPRPSTEDIQARQQASVTTLESLLASHGAGGRCLVVADEPGAGLVHQAEVHGASLLVVGTHGHTGFKRMALGSVAESVAKNAACSVLIAREKQT